MKKSVKIIIGIFLIGSVIGGIMTRCTTDVVADCPECMVLERTDIVITGALNAEDFQTSAQEDASKDLVSYNFYGYNTPQIDMTVRLDNGDQLIITMWDEETQNPWMQVGKAYNIYPNQELDDKLSSITVAYLNKEGGVTYATNGNSSLQGIQLDVFKIEANDGIEMRCRLRDLTLQMAGSNEQIQVNGTFVGAVDF